MTQDQPERLRDAPPDAGSPRRTLLKGLAAGGLALPLLSACGSGDSGGSGGGSAGGSGSGSGGSGGGVSVAESTVPVGGGVVVDQEVVVTQPSKGDFKAFSAICTHQGCPVEGVQNGEIVCPCHGSRFSAKDGSVVNGPAAAPLGAKKVQVNGGKVTVT